MSLMIKAKRRSPATTMVSFVKNDGKLNPFSLATRFFFTPQLYQRMAEGSINTWQIRKQSKSLSILWLKGKVKKEFGGFRSLMGLMKSLHIDLSLRYTKVKM